MHTGAKDLLDELLAAGRWPRVAAEPPRHNFPPERIRLLDPEMDRVYLIPPPFRSVRDLSAKERFWSERVFDPDGIDPGLAFVIGDFGLGSDTPILLDYRTSPTDPRVLVLRWYDRGEGNRWEEVAPTFSAFVAILGL